MYERSHIYIIIKYTAVHTYIHTCTYIHMYHSMLYMYVHHVHIIIYTVHTTHTVIHVKCQDK